jgi:hypothetical protein
MSTPPPAVVEIPRREADFTRPSLAPDAVGLVLSPGRIGHAPSTIPRSPPGPADRPRMVPKTCPIGQAPRPPSRHPPRTAQLAPSLYPIGHVLMDIRLSPRRDLDLSPHDSPWAPRRPRPSGPRLPLGHGRLLGDPDRRPRQSPPQPPRPHDSPSGTARPRLFGDPDRRPPPKLSPTTPSDTARPRLLGDPDRRSPRKPSAPSAPPRLPLRRGQAPAPRRRRPSVPAKVSGTGAGRSLRRVAQPEPIARAEHPVRHEGRAPV